MTGCIPTVPDIRSWRRWPKRLLKKRSARRNLEPFLLPASSIKAECLEADIRHLVAHLTDKFGRRISDLRISITDRCNYKCVYCRTGNEGALYGDLPFDDYLRMARILVGMGITKVRLTGGEPLLRKGVVDFVRELANLCPQKEREPLDIALTTNGHLLTELAQPLKDAGLTRVTVSMDAVDPDRFARITRVSDGYDHVLSGIRAA